MRVVYLFAALALAACQTDGVARNTGIGGYGTMVTSGPDMALANPDCRDYPGGLIGSWCRLRLVYMTSGKADPCSGVTGRDGHECRLAEVRAYADPVNNPAKGDFVKPAS